jgi:hypothetical protein
MPHIDYIVEKLDRSMFNENYEKTVVVVFKIEIMTDLVQNIINIFEDDLSDQQTNKLENFIDEANYFTKRFGRLGIKQQI